MSVESPPLRGYSELLLEEIALEGLDGITLCTLWRRLSVNPEWIMKPIDNFVEEFTWKRLVALTEIRWYKLPEPREDLPIFPSFDEYFAAIESKEIDPLQYGSKYYKYCEVKNSRDMGSCAVYKTRVEVTSEIKNCSLSTAKDKWSGHLVIVANQEVRNYVLFSGDLHYELDVLDITTYCILERIGRSRRCGELSISLNFIKNGANPTFYFWNKLRRRDLITSQNVCLKMKYSTLFFLKKFHEDVAKLTTSILVTIIKSIESSPQRACILSDMKQFSPRISKLLRCGAYKEHLRVEKIPYSEYYPNSKREERLSKNGKEKLVTVIKLIDKSEHRKLLQNCNSIDEDDVEDEEETEDYSGVLEETRLSNKTLVSQCFHVVDGAGVNGISQVEVGRKLGLNKLLTRMLLKTLMKNNTVVLSGAENAKTRYYKYYSKNFSYVKDSKLKQLSEMSEMFSSNFIAKSEDISDVSTTTEEQMSIDTGEPFSSEEKENAKSRETANNSEGVGDKILEVKSENLYTMRRANIILEHVYKNQVELKINLKQIIQKEENRQGFFQGDLDRRSMNKVLDMLVNCKKIKIITKNVTEPTFNKSRDIVFVCTPNVTAEHPAIKASIQQARDSLSILYVKHAGPQKKSVSELKPLLYIGTKNASKHGHAPKFVRMRVLHELLFYMLFSYKGDENLDAEDCVSFIRSVCDDFEKDEKLPKCYVKEISWKMFIPPLMKYEEYKDGWVAQNDVIERIPLRLLFMLIRLPHEIPHLQEYISHPIKQHYLVQDLPADMQKIIRVDKQYLYLLSLTFRFLAMVGLIQFGPKLTYRSNVSLIFVNRKATLLDTRSCPPGYSKIDTNLNYPIHLYELKSLSDIETYWSDAMRFALGTKLGKSFHKRTEMNVRDPERLPERLRELLKSCAVDEAPLRDTGKTPGNGLGALGFDSTLYPHLVRSWFFSRKRSSDSGSEKTEVVPPKKSKLMQQISSRTQVTKMKRYRYTVPKRIVKHPKTGKLTYDEVDEVALRNLKTMRVQWTKAEDDLLMLIQLAVLYSCIRLPGYRPRRLIRKMMHESCKKSLDKTALACSRRIYRLLKDKMKEHSLNVYLNELTQDSKLKTSCQLLLDEVEKISKEKNTANLIGALDKLTEHVFQYLRDNAKAAEITANGTYETTLPDDIETFKKLCHYEYPGVSNLEKAFLLQTENDIPVFVIINLIFSSLFSQVDKKKKINTNFMHHLFRNFDDSRLKRALAYVRLHRLISFNKATERSRSSYLPIGQGVYHLSMTFHLLLKSKLPIDIYNQMYARYLEMVADRECSPISITSYEAGLNLFLISYFILNEVQFDITIPKTVLFFDAKPLPMISPEEIAKPIFEATSSFTDKTLSLIRETFFDQNSEKSCPDKKTATRPDSDSDTDLELELDRDGERRECTDSNLTLFLTRRQFKQAEVRFSNAYDHFLINSFPMKYVMDSQKSGRRFSLRNDSENLISNMEKALTYLKLKYTVEEMSRKIQKYLSKSHDRDFASCVLDFLRLRGVSGATTYTLKSQYDDLRLLKKVLDALCKAKLVLRSGSKFTHYVHVEYAASWLLPCQKNVELYIEDNEKDEPIIINRNRTEKMMQSQNEGGQIWVHIKPWVHANGTINREALHSLLIRVVSYFTKCPCSSLEQIQNKFSPAIQPHYTRELLEVLEVLKCVKPCTLPPTKEVSLFSSDTFDWTIDDVATGFEDECTILFEVDVNAMIKLSVFIGNVNHKDLLEAKFVTDKYGVHFEMRVSGALLGKCIDKNVSLIGTVHAVHENSFNVMSCDNHDITVNLGKPCTGNISGLVEVRGIARSPTSISCDKFVVFPHDLAKTFDPQADNEAVNLAFRIPNPWK